MKKIIRGFILGARISTLLISTSFGTQIKKTIKVVYNSLNLIVNDVKINVDNILYNGTTYVPIRAVAEALGKKVKWHSSTMTARINDEVTYSSLNKEYKTFDNGTYSGQTKDGIRHGFGTYIWNSGDMLLGRMD